MKLTNKGKAWLYRFYAFLVYLIPMITLFIVNYQEYDKDGGAVGFWGIIVIAFVVLAFKGYILNLFKKQPITTVSIAIFVVALVMKNIAGQMILISAVSAIAALLSSFVSVVSDVFVEHSFKMVDGEKVKNSAPAISDKQAWLEAYGYIFSKEEE